MLRGTAGRIGRGQLGCLHSAVIAHIANFNVVKRGTGFTWLEDFMPGGRHIAQREPITAQQVHQGKYTRPEILCIQPPCCKGFAALTDIAQRFWGLPAFEI